jgi:hypothetical protein
MTHEILVNVYGTIIGGIALTLILFFCNEILFPIRNLSGEWEISSLTTKTAYIPYNNMRIIFKFHIVQKGLEITGSGEKVKEILANGPSYEYERDKRIIVEIVGTYKRNIFSSNKLYLNLIENGLKRSVRTTYILKAYSSNRFCGTFSSTAADSKGEIQMVKCD